MSEAETADERIVNRAFRELAQAGAWLDEMGVSCYAIRVVADRRRRALMQLDQAVFEVLAEEGGLKAREAGGWTLARPRPAGPDHAGRPSLIEGERLASVGAEPPRLRRANLGESPIAWLARRKDAAGRPWLTRIEAAAGEKLREDFHAAGTIGRMTMAWNAGPRGSGSRGRGEEPAERARAAKDRVFRALDAVGPGLRGMLEHVCLRGSALEAAERGLGLSRRTGKIVLKQALQRLATHYRMV